MNNHTENINLEHIKQQVRYLTNQQGQTTDVLIPLETWERIMQLLTAEHDVIDSKAELIADLKQSLLEAKQGKTFPLEELWEGIEE
jgi:tRNA/tmRNA/rRNA uracil-C5-methylase (TrmA/RlmC/RlmD family)